MEDVKYEMRPDKFGHQLYKNGKACKCWCFKPLTKEELQLFAETIKKLELNLKRDLY